MDKLLDSKNNSIAIAIKRILITHDVIKIENRLLDGKTHYQTVGNPRKIANVECYIDNAMKDKLLEADAILEPLKLIKDGITYTGIIKETPSIEIYISTPPVWYLANFTLTLGEV